MSDNNILVTKPPILNNTGQEIVKAIKALTNTDSSFSDPRRPANALEVGNYFKKQGDAIKSNFTIL